MMSIISERDRASARAWFSSRPTRRCALTRASSSRTRNGLGMKSAAPRPSERTVASSGRHRGDHEHRQVLEAGIGLDPLEQLETVHLGHHDVEQQQIERLGGQVLEQMLAAGDGEHVVAVLLEDPGQRAGERLVVVRHEDLGSERHQLHQPVEEAGIHVAAADHGHGRARQAALARRAAPPW